MSFTNPFFYSQVVKGTDGARDRVTDHGMNEESGNVIGHNKRKQSGRCPGQTQVAAWIDGPQGRILYCWPKPIAHRRGLHHRASRRVATDTRIRFRVAALPAWKCNILVQPPVCLRDDHPLGSMGYLVSSSTLALCVRAKENGSAENAPSFARLSLS